MGKKNTGKNTDGLIPWKEGDPSPNPNGRPKGQRNYATIYREALLKIAELDSITPEDLEDDMIAMAVKKARSGDPVFYKDVMDRVHGRPVQPVAGDKDNPVIVKVVKYE
jgi:hypothetical protein